MIGDFQFKKKTRNMATSFSCSVIKQGNDAKLQTFAIKIKKGKTLPTGLFFCLIILTQIINVL